MGFSRFHPHGLQHTFDFTDQLPPATDTLRLYVDGTAGNDAASGQGGWANAWKTMQRVLTALTSLFEIGPSDLRCLVRYRGVFSTEDFQWAAMINGTSMFVLAHDLADHTLNQAGTVVVATAPTEQFGLARLTLGGGIVLTVADIGRVLKLTDGATIGTSTIIAVDTVNNYCWTTKNSYPAWVVAGVVATIHTPSMSGVRDVSIALHSTQPTNAVSAVNDYSAIIGMVASSYTLTGTGRTGLACTANGAVTYPIKFRQAVSASLIEWKHAADPVSIFLEELGFKAGATGYALLGCYVPGGSGTYAVSSAGGGTQSLAGYFEKPFSAEFASSLTAQHANVGGLRVAAMGYGFAYRVISRGQFYLSASMGQLSWLNVTFQPPAAGIANGLVRLAGGAADGTLWEGDNTGTGATLYGMLIEKGARWVGSIAADLVHGKHGDIRVVEGTFESTAALSLAGREGGGPDIYVGELGSVRFADSFTKSAVNSETAIQNGADGQIVAVGTQFIAASAVFTSAHVGRSIKVSGAINPANNAVHRITAYTNPTTVVLGASAGLVNEGPGLTWGLVGTPAPILEVARGGRVSQASGKSFNIRHPEVDPDTAVQEWNNYGYGPNGAIYEHENAEVTLGTLVEAAGDAGATGVAATLRNKSSLLHSGGAVILGVAPLKIGAGAAIAWPATPVTDDTVAGAVISGEGNKLIPNV